MLYDKLSPLNKICWDYDIDSIDAYIILTKDDRFYPISKESLTRKLFRYLNMSEIKEVLTEDQFKKIIENINFDYIRNEQNREYLKKHYKDKE